MTTKKEWPLLLRKESQPSLVNSTHSCFNK
jgi:hypothetical protein